MRNKSPTCIEKMEIDPHLFYLMVLARNDVVSSKKVFGKICFSILGKHDDLLVNLGSSILETLVSTEKNQVSEVVAKSYNEIIVVYEIKLRAMSNLRIRKR